MADVREDPPLDLAATITEVQRLLDHGDDKPAQRLLERTWRDVPAEELELWEGLTRLLLGWNAATSGDRAAASDSLTRGAELLGSYEDHPPHALDIAGLRAWSQHLVRELGDENAAPPPVPRLRLP